MKTSMNAQPNEWHNNPPAKSLINLMLAKNSTTQSKANATTKANVPEIIINPRLKKLMRRLQIS
jgi:hypothetical protein